MKKFIDKTKSNMQDYVGRILLGNMILNMRTAEDSFPQRKSEYYEWLHSDLMQNVDEFIKDNKLENSSFVKELNSAFETGHFETFLKKFITEYLSSLFEKLDDSAKNFQELVLEDNPLNRFGAEKYTSKFRKEPVIKWRTRQNVFLRIFGLFLKCIIVLQMSLNRGLKISGKREKYKVMREALWGLYDAGGLYFHDDFLVDGDNLKEEDLILFSRGLSAASGREKPYQDACRSRYAHFNVNELAMGINPFLKRIIPKYIFSGIKALFLNIDSPDYSLFSTMFLYFIRYAMPYEKIFSNYKINAELGHNFYSPGHVIEAIVCQNHGAKYSLMHWSDTAIEINKYLTSHLACDNYFVWGEAHVTGVEGPRSMLVPTGYVFKQFIKDIRVNRNKILREMGISAKEKIVSFFDETFRSKCKMTEEHYINFWKTALNLARRNKDITVLIKPKTLVRYKGLSKDRIEEFLKIKAELDNLPDVYIVDDVKWSFIEVIGVSDIVITQGMFSSATIAIICGIEGLYLDEALYNHPFRRRFKDKIVFDDPEKLLETAEMIVKNAASPIKDIPESLLREFDAFRDENGIQRFRNVLTGI